MYISNLSLKATRRGRRRRGRRRRRRRRRGRRRGKEDDGEEEDDREDVVDGEEEDDREDEVDEEATRRDDDIGLVSSNIPVLKENMIRRGNSQGIVFSMR